MWLLVCSGSCNLVQRSNHLLDNDLDLWRVSPCRDVRAAVDLCHRDGSLKQTVAADPGRYMHGDPRLAPMLESMRASGRKVFLATNSLWDYTHVVMNFLICGAPCRQPCA